MLAEEVTADAGRVARVIASLFGRDRLLLRNEFSLHAELALRLQKAGIAFSREVRVGPKKRPDFMIDGVAVELKVKGSDMAILRQLKRYADDPTIPAVVLLTTKPIAMVPAELGGKQIVVVELWKNLL